MLEKRPVFDKDGNPRICHYSECHNELDDARIILDGAGKEYCSDICFSRYYREKHLEYLRSKNNN